MNKIKISQIIQGSDLSNKNKALLLQKLPQINQLEKLHQEIDNLIYEVKSQSTFNKQEPLSKDQIYYRTQIIQRLINKKIAQLHLRTAKEMNTLEKKLEINCQHALRLVQKEQQSWWRKFRLGFKHFFT